MVPSWSLPTWGGLDPSSGPIVLALHVVELQRDLEIRFAA